MFLGEGWLLGDEFGHPVGDLLAADVVFVVSEDTIEVSVDEGDDRGTHLEDVLFGEIEVEPLEADVA